MIRIKAIFVFLLVLALHGMGFAEYSLPSYVDIDFSGAGVDGGIPTRPVPVTGSTYLVNSYGAIADDANSDSSALSSALGAASAGDVVEFGSGKYILTTTFSVPEGVVLRGQGMDNTTLEYTGTSGTIISAGDSGSCTWNDQWCVQVPLYASGSMGDTTLTLDTGDGDYTSFAAGDMIIVGMDNSGLDWINRGGPPDDDDCGWNVVNNDAGGDVSYMQMVEVVSRVGSTLTITPGLYADMPTSQNVFVGKDSNDNLFQSGIGLEHFKLTRTQDYTSQTSTISFQHLKDSWVIGVEIDKGAGRMLNMQYCYQLTIRGNYIHHGWTYASGGNNYHFVLGPATTRSLIENNVSGYTNNSMITETDGGGNVIAYNYFQGSWVNDVGGNTNWQVQNMSSHCSHSHHNLFEGNWAARSNMDDIHGSSSHYVYLRNRFTSDNDFLAFEPTHDSGDEDTEHIAAMGFDNGYYAVVIGNVLGLDSRTNTFECASELTGCATGVGNNYIHMFRGHDVTGVSPYSTILRHHNYDYYNDDVVNNASDDTDMPDSFYLTSKPSWWDDEGTRPWPSISPDAPGSVIDIPAKDRHEGETYSGTDTTDPAVSSATINGTAAVVGFDEDLDNAAFANLIDGDLVFTGTTTGAVDLQSCSEVQAGILNCIAASTFATNETVTLSSSGLTGNEICDTSSNCVPSLSGESVTNNTPSPPDTTDPTVDSFVIPANAPSLIVSITTLNTSDNVAVTGICVNESATPPTAGTCSGSGWLGIAPSAFTFGSEGAKTLYAWAKDEAGNISTPLNDSVTVSIPSSSVSSGGGGSASFR